MSVKEKSEFREVKYLARLAFSCHILFQFEIVSQPLFILQWLGGMPLSGLSDVWLAELAWSVCWAPRSGPAAAEEEPGQAQPPERGSGEAGGGTWTARFPTWRIYQSALENPQRLCGGFSITLSQEQPRENGGAVPEAKCFPAVASLRAPERPGQPGPALGKAAETSGCPGKGGWGETSRPSAREGAAPFWEGLDARTHPLCLSSPHPALQSEVPARSLKALGEEAAAWILIRGWKWRWGLEGGWLPLGPEPVCSSRTTQSKALPTFAKRLLEAPSTVLRAAKSLILPPQLPRKVLALRQ